MIEKHWQELTQQENIHIKQELTQPENIHIQQELQRFLGTPTQDLTAVRVQTFLDGIYPQLSEENKELSLQHAKQAVDQIREREPVTKELSYNSIEWLAAASATLKQIELDLKQQI